MNALALFVAAVAILCAFGLTVWLWLVVANAANELLTFVGVEGMHLQK
ncbi:hypothetical protein [Piscinibacter sp.]|jgi:hypothetical protein